jgi:hypothetical protein
MLKAAIEKGPVMVNARGFARFGVLAVGLGIGAAVASTPGVAWADDFQISIDGMDLFPELGNTAFAKSGIGDIAIAYGNNAYATAWGGTGDFALASGSQAYAAAGGQTGDTGADDDTAIDIGNRSDISVGAAAGNADTVGATDGGTGSGDTAINIGNDTGLYSGVFAGAGGIFGATGNGNDDTAIAVGNNSGIDTGAYAVDGNDNYASYFGDQSNDYASAFTGYGNNNIAEADGPNSTADADGGDGNSAYVFDPFGTDGSQALAGEGNVAQIGEVGNYDQSAVFGDDLVSSHATYGNFLYDILSPAGDLPGSAATTSGGFLAELLSLF